MLDLQARIDLKEVELLAPNVINSSPAVVSDHVTRS